MSRCLFIVALLVAMPAISRAEVPPSEPLRVRPQNFDYAWRAAASSPNNEPDRRYYYGQQNYAFATYGGWYRPTFYFGNSNYTYRGVGINSSHGYGPGSLNRFYGRVPTRWLRNR